MTTENIKTNFFYLSDSDIMELCNEIYQNSKEYCKIKNATFFKREKIIFNDILFYIEFKRCAFTDNCKVRIAAGYHDNYHDNHRTNYDIKLTKSNIFYMEAKNIFNKK